MNIVPVSPYPTNSKSNPRKECLSPALSLYQLELYHFFDHHWIFLKSSSNYPHLYEKMVRLTNPDISDIQFLLVLTTLNYKDMKYLKQFHIDIPIESLIADYLEKNSFEK